MAVLVLAATLGTIAFNSLAAAGYVNGVTPAAISARYQTILTPAGWAFSIWSLIYVGITAFSVYQLLPSAAARFDRVRMLYIVSCVLNCAWIYFWHHDQIAICLAVITALLVTLILILWQLRGDAPAREALFTKAPFGLYAGWVTAATLVNLTVWLTAANVDITAQAWKAIGIACLLVAAAAAVIVRFKFRNFLYPIAVAWAATAIAVKQSGSTAIIVAAAVCVIVCLIMSLSFVMDQKRSTI